MSSPARQSGHPALVAADVSTEDAGRLDKRIVDNLPGAVLRYRQHPDGSGEVVYASGGVAGLLGRLDVEPGTSFGTFAKRVFIGDLPALRKSVDDSAAKLSHWNHEWRIVSDDGDIRCLEGIGRPERCAAGCRLTS